MKFTKKLISMVVVITMLASVLGFVPAYAASPKYDNPDAADVMSDNSAYAIFTSTPSTRDVTSIKYTKKMEDLSKTTESSITPSYATYEGITGVKLSKNQYMYITLDNTKLTSSKYLVIVKFYDPGNEEQFKIRYKSGSNTYDRVIQKTGMKAEWVTESFIIDGITLGGKLDQSSDLCIYAGDNGVDGISTPVPGFVLGQIELVDYSDSDVYFAGKISSSKLSNKTSGRTAYYMNFNGKPAIKPYVIAQSWNYRGTKFIFASYDTMQVTELVDKEVVKEVIDPETGEPVTDPKSHKLYEYDTASGLVTCLDTNLNASLVAIVTYDNQIYYTKNDGYTWKIDWFTYKKQPTKARTYGTMNVTNDGEWVSGYGGASNQVVRSNTQTGADLAFSIQNAKNIWASNTKTQGKGHPMVNPEYPHLEFFCHEGTTQYIPDRLWLANYNTNLAYNMFVQTPHAETVNDEVFQTSETSGHEAWGANGENMYWVKYYNSSKNVGQSGIMRTEKYGSNREYINGYSAEKDGYHHWHCFPSMDDNFVVSDTNVSPNQIVVTNVNTYEATVVSSFSNEDRYHPNQPHPNISGNNYAVNWQGRISGQTCIAWTVVRDVTKNVKPTNRYSFGEGTEITTCEDAVSATTDYTKDGVAYKKAAKGKGVYVDIMNKVCASTNATVTLEISYLDEGTNPLVVTYTTGVEDVYDISTRENATYEIEKTGTGTQKTTTITLENINANTIGKFRSDINISSDDGAYISNVNAYCEPVGRELYTNAQIYSYASGIGAEQSSGLKILYGETGSDYNSTLWHVDDVEGWSNQGVTQELVDEAIAAGYSYVTEYSDGAWMYKEVTDKSDFQRAAYFTTNNFRKHNSSKKVGGAFYLYLTDDTITENDNRVTFNITYLDRKDIKVCYTANTESGLADFTIPGTDSGLWKTALITVDNAKLSSTNTNTKLATKKEDIKIESRGGDMYVSSISITKEQQMVESDLYTQGIYYNGYENIVKVSDKISVSADNNALDCGIVCTEKANYSSYNSPLYHVDDKEGWQAAGITQEHVDAAIESDISYVTKDVDGAWMYQEFTDADGVTKMTFYAPRNYRHNSSNAKINSNLYFRLTDETFTTDDNHVVVAIEYLDIGKNMTFTYTGDEGLSSVVIAPKNTGKWETAYVTISDSDMSSTNSGTRLANHKEDIKITVSETPIASISVMKKYDGSDDEYEILGDTAQKLTMNAGDVASPVAVVTNKSEKDADVSVYNLVYDSDMNIKSIELSDVVTIPAGSTDEISTPERAMLIGETQKLLVWNSNLMPLSQLEDPLGLMITQVPGSVKVWWNNQTYPGYFINIYRGNEIVGRTNGDYCILDNLKKGTNTITVDLADSYGRVLLRSKPIDVIVK